jgi:hypothetical protein
VIFSQEKLTMTKKALLIGLNEYSGDINGLRGCVNDVEQVKGLLKTYYGFSDDAIKVLVNSQATKAGILAGLDWLILGSQAGDVLIFHYSGHGSQVPDDGNDELDSADEIIIPFDHDWDNPLRDDDLKAAFARIGPGVSLTVMMDCCHSGTGNRPAPAADADLATLPLPRYLNPPEAVQVQIDQLAQARRAVIESRVGDAPASIVSAFTAMGNQLIEALSRLLGRRRSNRFQVVKTTENNVLVAACRDDQTSADAYIANDYHGAFTWCLAEAIQATAGHLTYRELAQRIGVSGQAYAQQPQLECQPALLDRQVFSPAA